jgi:vacuolar-type H+-ATPase subunit F/Vma7
VRRLALVAERETVAGVQLIGVGRYEPGEEPDTAEVAFVVEDG